VVEPLKGVGGGEVKPPEPLRKIIYPEFFENLLEPHEKQEKLVKTVCYVAQTRFFCVHLP